ncbi:uncharacterized protein LOC124938820 [Impatiens glandulifera]|uniref:uncharacterized protein LOC124938820 n=1 Tax=Impatiens glandulifera TaxID=253017 RepID=UPI001FB07F22|nr:uncharacterized protein LOC124938820 [Impatiens glandulifera]
MKQVDLETLVSACAGGGVDRKIACETLADGEKPPEQDDPSTELPPDFPPESFWLSKDAEYDWFDRNAFLERKESTKGNSNFYSNVFPSSNSSSQRFSSNLKSKTGIIGLPKTQKTAFVDSSTRRICKHANVSLFPKRSESMAKSAVVVTEPSSPNVSCIGRVRSKKGRRRRSKDKDKDKTNTAAANQVEKSRSTGKYQTKKKKGIYMKIVGIFRSDRKKKKEVVDKNRQQSKEEETPRTSSSAVEEFSPATVTAAVNCEPPGLGGMKRFTSGRRSTSSVDEETGRRE